MSHYAEIDDNKIVLRVLVGNPNLDDDQGLEEITNLLGGTWLRTSYNAKIRGNFASIGYSYLEIEDLFMPPKCHDEAVLNANLAIWECPNPEHSEGFTHAVAE